MTKHCLPTDWVKNGKEHGIGWLQNVRPAPWQTRHRSVLVKRIPNNPSSVTSPLPLQFQHNLPPIRGSPGRTIRAGAGWPLTGGNGRWRLRLSDGGESLTTDQSLPYLSQHFISRIETLGPEWYRWEDGWGKLQVMISFGRLTLMIYIKGFELKMRLKNKPFDKVSRDQSLYNLYCNTSSKRQLPMRDRPKLYHPREVDVPR